MFFRAFCELCLDADRIPVPNAYKMNRDDKWSPATPPLHYDKKVAGYGPADALPKSMMRVRATTEGDVSPME